MKKFLLLTMSVILMSLSVVAFGQPSKATVESFNVLMVPMSDPEWGKKADILMADVKAGAVKTVPSKNPEADDYIVCRGRLDWSNLVETSPGVGLDNRVVQQVVIERSRAGVDDISLDMVNVRSFSSDSDSILTDGLTLTGMSLNRRAFIIKANGTIVESGPTSTKGMVGVFITQMKLFTAGDIFQLEQARKWILARNLVVTYKVKILGDASSEVATVVYATDTSIPSEHALSIKRGFGGAMVVSLKSQRGTCMVMASDSILGPWVSMGVISGTESLSFQRGSGYRFFRAE